MLARTTCFCALLTFILHTIEAPHITQENIAHLAVNLAAPLPSTDQVTKSRFEDVIRYHFESKHFFDVQAEVPKKYMDWDTQPSPWRTYAGAPRVALPRQILHDVAKTTPSSVGFKHLNPSPLSPASLGSLLRLAFGISAWKSYDGVHKWALRVNPSSGNLQTTEVHLVLPALGDPIADFPAVYHYQPEWHALELRSPAPAELVTNSVGEAAGLLVLFTTLCVREAWKYGNRALRSCHLNLGHALGALRAACELHGWVLDSAPLPALAAREVLEAVFGLPSTLVSGTSTEEEMPELALLVRTHPSSHGIAIESVPTNDLIAVFQAIKPWGQAEPLSPSAHSAEYQQWPVMDAAQQAIAVRLEDRIPASSSMATNTAESLKGASFLAHLQFVNGSLPADIILQRRSALKMVRPRHALPRKVFLSLLHALCQGPQRLHKERGVHLLIMVHNVQSMLPGLYLLVRSVADVEPLRVFAQGASNRMTHLQDLRSSASLQDVELDKSLEELALSGCSLVAVSVPADVTQVAQLSACNQEIAAEGALAVAFIGRFHGWHHPHRYAELHWEAGELAQMLYLAAQAAGLGSTGIGCFFDDFTLSLLRDPGIDPGSSTGQTFDSDGTMFQVLYHFSMGHVDKDERLLSYDPYHHLEADTFLYEPLQGGVSRIRRRL